MDIKEALAHLSDAMQTQLHGVKALTGKHDEKFRELFQVTADSKIYYTKMNMIITSDELMGNLKHFLKAEDKVLSVEIPEYNVHIWIYEHFNNSVINTYLPIKLG